MNTVEEILKDTVSLEDVQKALVTARSYPLLSDPGLEAVAEATASDFKNALKHIIKLRTNGEITDDDFTELVYLVCVSYIEHEVEDKIKYLFENKFNKVFHRKLSPSKLHEML